MLDFSLTKVRTSAFIIVVFDIISILFPSIRILDLPVLCFGVIQPSVVNYVVYFFRTSKVRCYCAKILVSLCNKIHE